MRHLFLIPLLLVAAALGAQDSTCSYDRCAVWRRDNRLLAGWPGRKLPGGGDALLVLATTSDSARAHALSYRRNYDIGMPLSYIGLGGFVSYMFHQQVKHGHFAVAPGTTPEYLWYFASVGATVAGAPFLLTAGRSAARMAWWYNRELDRPTSVQRDSACTYDRCALWLRERAIMIGMPGTRMKKPYETLPSLLEGREGHEYAASYRKQILRGNTLRWAGVAFVGAGVISLGLRGFDEGAIGFPALELAAFAGGAIAFEAGIFTTLSAQRDAERAVWWYNRALP